VNNWLAGAEKIQIKIAQVKINSPTDLATTSAVEG
jgi:hypothetical protein